MHASFRCTELLLARSKGSLGSPRRAAALSRESEGWTASISSARSSSPRIVRRLRYCTSPRSLDAEYCDGEVTAAGDAARGPRAPSARAGRRCHPGRPRAAAPAPQRWAGRCAGQIRESGPSSHDSEAAGPVKIPPRSASAPAARSASRTPRTAVAARRSSASGTGCRLVRRHSWDAAPGRTCTHR